MTSYPAFCATCHMVEHDARPCDQDALERRRRIVALMVAYERLTTRGRRERDVALNYRRAARLFSASATVALRVSALLAEEADAIMGRR